MKNLLFEYDEAVRCELGAGTENDAPFLCGIDEAGRGPLAGPVCAAAVVLPAGLVIDGINDSKKLTEKKRELLFDEIIKKAVCYNVVMVGPEVIDEINILQATFLAMKTAVEGLAETPQLVLIDGNAMPKIDLPMRALIKGDGISASVAAASILAKVTRDRHMKELALQHPEYKLEQHKGYPTKLHYECIEQHGVQSFHRKSFLKKRGLDK